MLDLEPIKKRLEAASEPPWLTPEQAGDPYHDDVPIDHEGCDVWPWHNESDMILAYAARTDIPALIAEIERLREAIDSLDRRSFELMQKALTGEQQR